MAQKNQRQILSSTMATKADYLSHDDDFNPGVRKQLRKKINKSARTNWRSVRTQYLGQ